MKTTIYLIRHAEAAGNVERTFQGHTDAPVTEKGYRQLACLARRFEKIHLDGIYCSPLLRTRETALAAGRDHGLSLQLEPGLIEINGGDIEGMKWSEIPLKYPEQNRLWEEAPHLYEAPGGESMRQVYDRMKETMDRIAAQNLGKTICVASHGAAIRNYLCYALGWPYERLRDVMWEENTAVSLIEYQDGKPHVVCHNDVSHLDSELCTVRHQDWWRDTVAEEDAAAKEGAVV